MDWTLKPGEVIRRTELHKQFGGSGQGGISPSSTTQNVLIFSDPEVGTLYGYNETAGDQTVSFTTRVKGSKVINVWLEAILPF
jgi:hypothetical protein